jgi:hypothetical protein
LWAFVYFGSPLHFAIMAAVGAAASLLWMAALWLSLRRQRRRERHFGNTLREEIARNLSILDYQLSRYGRWGSALLWSAPVMIGGTALYWLGVEVNYDPGESRWEHAWMLAIFLWAAVFLPYSSSRDVRKKLEPRRQRLGELLDMLNRGE